MKDIGTTIYGPMFGRNSVTIGRFCGGGRGCLLLTKGGGLVVNYIEL